MFSGICTYCFFSSRRRHTICSRDWSSDVCSSDLAPAPTVITQTADKLTIETHFGDQVRTSTYNLDGSESTNPGRGGDSKSKAHWDGASLVIETTNASGSTSKSVRSLSADGKTMTVVTTSQGQNGEQTRKTVYDKQ